MSKDIDRSIEEAGKALLKAILRRIREIMREEYGLSKVSIKPLGSEGSRLSIPCKIVGTKGKVRISYFAKIIGSSDFVSALSIQFIKNIYLQMNSKAPIFGSHISAEQMARYQYETLSQFYHLKVPTAKPFGYHPIDDTRWLLVAEWIDAKPLSDAKVEAEIMDKAFLYLRMLHDARLFHGDIKPDNIMPGKKLYILDVGLFKEKVPITHKRSYDLACMICSFIHIFPESEIVSVARKYYPPRELKAAAEYIGFIQKRPDFYITDELVSRLRRRMRR